MGECRRRTMVTGAPLQALSVSFMGALNAASKRWNQVHSIQIALSAIQASETSALGLRSQVLRVPPISCATLSAPAVASGNRGASTM